MTAATLFNEREAEACYVARLIEDNRTYWVAGGGGPMYSVLLAQRMGYAPGAMYMTEDGVVAPQPLLPFDPIQTMVSARPGYRALQWGTMSTAQDYAALGLFDYGILNTLQVDKHGNINSTFLGEYPDAGRRFGGPGGADSIAGMCWRTILMTDQQRRKFVERVDFISSPGFLDGSEGARERAGLPADTGPWRVVTPAAMYDYDENRCLRLIAVSAWTSVSEVLEECDSKPRLADTIEVLAPPTEEELNIYRTELDVRGQTSDRGDWITFNGERYERVRE
ncbi:MAG: acyl CoA--acetate/3-ketoacid CoA transferase subunit beta [Dehalococcoidia bacterium]|jgi:glutaconate CoA-transferase subunit B